MKRFTRITALLLLGGAIYFGVEGYRNYRLTEASDGHFEHPVHLDQTGRISVIANVPGRSMFRPGGVLEFKLGNKQAIPPNGKETVKVIDGRGVVALEANLEDFSLYNSPRGGVYLRSLREFETINGGPYEITVEVTEAFQNIGPTPQILTARHFVSGTAEVVVFLLPLAFGGLMLVGAGVLILRARKVSGHSGIVTPARVD